MNTHSDKEKYLLKNSMFRQLFVDYSIKQFFSRKTVFVGIFGAQLKTFGAKQKTLGAQPKALGVLIDSLKTF